MSEQVAVRFVPKSRVAAPRSLMMADHLQPSSAAEFAPDRGRANDALKALSSLNLPTQVSEANRLESHMPVSQFSELFAVDLTRESSAVRIGKGRTHSQLTHRETFLKPLAELPVPEELKETVEFAYVPRPVEYYAPSFIPPNEAVYHLTLQSVALALNVVRCHRENWTGAGVKVAMADSGFALHPFFEQSGSKIIRLGAPGVNDPTVDNSGHGTGESANIVTVAPSTTIVCVKQGESAAAAVETCIAQQPDVMTHSWGWSADNVTKDQLKIQDPNLYNEFLDIETLVLEAVAQDITVCFSAGNGHLSFPACLPQVIAVGGVTVRADGSLVASSYASSFRSTLYPNRNVPDLCGIVGEASAAPMKGHIMLPVPSGSDLDGENFSPSRKGEGWGIFSGTSAASPQAAGVIALMRSINRNLKPQQIRSILASSTVDVKAGKTALGDKAEVGPDLATGAGFMDAYRACKAAAAMV